MPDDVGDDVSRAGLPGEAEVLRVEHVAVKAESELHITPYLLSSRGYRLPL